MRLCPTAGAYALAISIACAAAAQAQPVAGDLPAGRRGPFLASPCESPGWRPPSCHSDSVGDAPPPPESELGGPAPTRTESAREPGRPSPGAGPSPADRSLRFDALLRCHVVMNYVSLKATDKPFKKTMAGASRGFRDSLIREKVAAGDTRAGALRFIDRRMNEKGFVVLDDASETGLAKAVKVCLELDR